MQSHFLSDAIVPQRAANATAAGTTAINGATVDMQTAPTCRSCLFLAFLGALTATQVTQLKMQVSDDGTTWADAMVNGSIVQTAAAADADSNKILMLDVRYVGHRYVRPVLVRGTANAVLDAMISIPYESTAMPTIPSGLSKTAQFLNAV